MLYIPVPSAWGNLHIGWQDTPAGPRIHCVLLPSASLPLSGDIAPPRPVAELCERIQRYISGEEVYFDHRDLNLLALEGCTHFQKQVLLTTYAVPRGQVTTYSGIAACIGAPNAARAVGNALAYNPFPIIIPCHRVVRADGRLGGYGGGLEMKRALLELEGVHISPAGIVDTQHAVRNTQPTREEVTCNPNPLLS